MGERGQQVVSEYKPPPGVEREGPGDDGRLREARGGGFGRNVVSPNLSTDLSAWLPWHAPLGLVCPPRQALTSSSAKASSNPRAPFLRARSSVPFPISAPGPSLLPPTALQPPPPTRTARFLSASPAIAPSTHLIPLPMDPGSSNPGASLNIKKQEDMDGLDPKSGQKLDQKPVVRTLNRVPRKSPFCIPAVRRSDRIHRTGSRCMCEFRGCRSLSPIIPPHPPRPCQNACRKQKMRCEGAENPPCRRCRHAGLECLFEKPTREASLTGEAGLE